MSEAYQGREVDKIAWKKSSRNRGVQTPTGGPVSIEKIRADRFAVMTCTFCPAVGWMIAPTDEEGRGPGGEGWRREGRREEKPILERGDGWSRETATEVTVICEHKSLDEGALSRIGNRNWRCLDCGARKILAEVDLEKWCRRYQQTREAVVRALLR